MKKEEMKEKVKGFVKGHKTPIALAVTAGVFYIFGYRKATKNMKNKIDKLPVLDELFTNVIDDAYLKYGGEKNNATICALWLDDGIISENLGELGNAVAEISKRENVPTPETGFTHFIAIGPSE